MPLAGHLLTSARPGEYLPQHQAEAERKYLFDKYWDFCRFCLID